jgi:hypothetical protein
MGDMRFFCTIFCIGIGLLVGAACLVPAGEAGAEDKRITVGELEDVILLPWGVTLPARIDTGASMSSLDARDLEIVDDVAHFKLAKKYGGLALSLPVKDWKYIRSASGRQKRPVVEVEFCIGSKRVTTMVNLFDRGMVKYPVILGRNVLRDQFVVDCTKQRCAPPQCPGITAE